MGDSLGIGTKQGHFLLRPDKIGMNKIGTSEKWNGENTVNALRTLASSRSSSNMSHQLSRAKQRNPGPESAVFLLD